MHVVFSPAAIRDLLANVDFIAKDSPARGDAFVRKLDAAARALERFPLRGRPRSELGRGVRAKVLGAYVIL
jgi:plasmid stabilization system protein ParE